MTVTQPTRTSTAERADALEKLLRQQLDDHQALLSCVQRTREALRLADMAAFTAAAEQEQSIVQRQQSLEPQRRRLIDALSSDLAPGEGAALTVCQLAERLEEPRQGRLLVLAAQLRESAERIRAESTVVRTAAEALGRHVSGVMQTLQSALSRARVYGSAGRIDSGAQMDFSVDVKS